MLPRILSIAGPFFVYITLLLVLWGLYCRRAKFKWWTLTLAGTGFLFSILLVPNIHRLFFDEDIYINIASNLSRAPVAQLTLLGVTYLIFYAGSFEVNPRYAIQILAPMVLLGVRLLQNRYMLVSALITLIAAYAPSGEIPRYVSALASDHEMATQFAGKLGSNDLMISAEPEIFVNYGVHAMNAAFATEQEPLLREQFRRHPKVWYHSGVRTNVAGSREADADRWVKSHLKLYKVDSREVHGFSVSLYEASL